MKKEYTLEKLGCAHCAAQMETEIKKMAKVKSASIDFATARLVIESEDFAGLQDSLQEICGKIEPDVRVMEKNTVGEKLPRVSYSNITQILLGIVLYGMGLADFLSPNYNQILFFSSYLILGGKIIWKALRNLAKGDFFDENFLMAIATVGAFLIGEYPEAVGVMLFYRIGEHLEQQAVAKTRKRITETVDLRPETVRLVSGETTKTSPIGDAKIGDLIQLRPGDRVPLDGVITEGDSRVDTSPVTGEPVPVRAFPGKSIVSGSINISGLLTMRVEKELADSMASRILDSVENALLHKPKLDRLITRFARIYTPVVVAVAIATAVIPGYFTGEWQYWLYTALTFLVISCPCALVLSVPLTFFAGIGAASRQGILFKSGSALEMLGNVKAVIMDKTGTLTEGNFAVQQVQPAEGVSVKALLAISAGLESTSLHPIAQSIVAYAAQNEVELATPKNIEEIAGEGIAGFVAQDFVLCGNQKLLERHKVQSYSINEASVGTEVLVAVNGNYWGRLILADKIKPDAAEAVAAIRQRGIFTAVLTGDSEERAEVIARAIKVDSVSAKLLPDSKMAELRSLREKYGAVMYVGDGINDAPALAAADVGAAMGSGVDAAAEVADIVFMTRQVSVIPESIILARKTLLIAKQNIVFALLVKVIVMLMGLLGTASMWLAVFADSGVALLCVLNALRLLKSRI